MYTTKSVIRISMRYFIQFSFVFHEAHTQFILFDNLSLNDDGIAGQWEICAFPLVYMLSHCVSNLIAHFRHMLGNLECLLMYTCVLYGCFAFVFGVCGESFFDSVLLFLFFYIIFDFLLLWVWCSFWCFYFKYFVIWLAIDPVFICCVCM